MFDLWYAYWQVEPFGRQWEQTASILSMLSGAQSLQAATAGCKIETKGVVDFMPAGSVGWDRRRQAEKRKGTTDPRIQSMMLKQAFGFR